MPRQRPTLIDSRYELDGLSFDAKQFEANSSDIDGHLILKDAACFGSTPVFDASSGIKITEDDDSLICDGRMLSATLIRGHWVDYSDPALWTDATAKKFATTLYLDHYATVANWIGAATNPRISNENGLLGVDATFKIDKKRDMVLTEGAICSGMKHNPPTVKNFSVGINHKLKKSHTFEDPWDFWEKLGTEVDGQIVRFICTSIDRIRECSLVYAGADPNAKAYNDISPRKIGKGEILDSEEFSPGQIAEEVKRQLEQFTAKLKPAASAASHTGDGQMPSAMFLKMIKDLTGIDYSEDKEGDIIPALYSIHAAAKTVPSLTERLATAEKSFSDLEKSERDRLMKIGLEDKKNINDDMKDWALSLSLDKLRSHVEKAKSLTPPEVKPASEATHKEGKFVVPAMPEDISHSDVELIAQRMGMKREDVYKHAAKVG